MVEESRVPGEKHRPAINHRQTLSHNVVSNTFRLNEEKYESQGQNKYNKVMT